MILYRTISYHAASIFSHAPYVRYASKTALLQTIVWYAKYYVCLKKFSTFESHLFFDPTQLYEKLKKTNKSLKKLLNGSEQDAHEILLAFIDTADGAAAEKVGLDAKHSIFKIFNKIGGDD